MTVHRTPRDEPTISIEQMEWEVSLLRQEWEAKKRYHLVLFAVCGIAFGIALGVLSQTSGPIGLLAVLAAFVVASGLLIWVRKTAKDRTVEDVELERESRFWTAIQRKKDGDV